VTKHWKRREQDRFRYAPKPAPTSRELMMGTIKSFSHGNGYGFLFPDGRPGELYFHVTDVRREELSDLCTGQRVSFVIGERNGRPRAIDVELI
jgi:cold shock CspA family protein